MQWVVHKCLSGSVDLKRVEPQLKAIPARDDRQHWETRKWLLVRTVLLNNRRLIVREIADDCGISVGSCDAILNENDRKNGGMATGSCTTTMRPHTLHILCSSFWPNMAPLSCSSRHTHQISHCVTFSYSQGFRKFWKDIDEATEDIKRNLTKTLLDIPKEEFAKCFQQWQKRWAKWVAAEGNYVEDN